MTISAENRNEAKTIKKNALLSKKTYYEKLIESLIKFADFILSDDQFVIDIRNELIIHNENIIIH